MSIVAARPVFDDSGQVMAVLAGRTDLAVLDEIMGQAAGLGNTGQTYLVGLNRAMLTKPRLPAPEIYVRTAGVGDGTRISRQQL